MGPKVKSSTKNPRLKVYVFGNESSDLDNRALNASKSLGDSLPNIGFVIIKPNEDLPFDNRQDVVIMDVVKGLTEVRLIKNDDLDKIILSPRTTAHDYDLGFQLKYLKKLGRLGKVTIIGLPMRKKINYNLLRNLTIRLIRVLNDKIAPCRKKKSHQLTSETSV